MRSWNKKNTGKEVETLKIKLNFQSNDLQCAMKECRGHQGENYIEIHHTFPNVSKTNDFHHLHDNQGVISVFETNIREQPTLQSTILDQLYLRDIVTIQQQHGQWLYVESKKRAGWIPVGTIQLASMIQAREQLIGETHHAIICETCLQALNWEEFYVEEIEPNLKQHVVNDLMLAYLESAVALEHDLAEDASLPFEELEARVNEEVDSGLHGDPLRFNKEEILKNYQTKRA